MLGHRIVGACLLILGILALIGQLTGRGDWFGYAFLLTIAAGFLVAYYQSKQIGFLIPGAIVGALGLAVFFMETFSLPEIYGSTFVLGFLGLAFFCIYLLGSRPNAWPLYPAFSLWGIAALVLMVGDDTYYIGKIAFPALLILAGIWWIAFPRKSS